MTLRLTLKITSLLVLGTLAGCQSAYSTSKADLGNDTMSIVESPREGIVAAKYNFKAGNYGLAERNFRLAVESDASNAEAWLGLGATYDQLGRYDLADRSYKQVLKIAGPVPQLLNNMGYSNMLRGNRKKAKTLFSKASKALPENETIIGNKQLLAKL